MTVKFAPINWLQINNVLQFMLCASLNNLQSKHLLKVIFVVIIITLLCSYTTHDSKALYNTDVATPPSNRPAIKM